MTPIIHLLPDTVANQIAAGEVIQRPAHVVKELMENALDAGASSIVVSVVDAGRTLVQVVDDGTGMNETDARLAFERHATSKIATWSDMQQLRTMGFRGEALPSIAAVAEVEVFTRQEDQELGLRLQLSGSSVECQEPAATPKGTKIAVRNLFFNVPARRRFLKSDAAEMRHLVGEFLRVALAHPEVACRLTSGAQTLYALPPSGLKQRIANVAGKKMSDNLLAVETATALVSISGFVGTPATARKTAADQWLFVNGRYMRSPYFNHAIAEAYKGILPPDQSPAFYVFFEVPPDQIDVNSSPQKTEIKFENDQAVYKILRAAVSKTLNDSDILPSIDFDSGERIPIPQFQASGTANYDPFAREREQARQWQGGQRPNAAAVGLALATLASPRGGSPTTPTTAAGALMPDPEMDGHTVIASSINGGEATDGLSTEPPPDDEVTLSQLAAQQPLWLQQHDRRYILASYPGALLVIDQRRAHERILYEALRASGPAARHESQRLMFPEVVELPADDLCLLEEVAPELHDLGVEISIDRSRSAVVVEATPPDLDASAVRDLVETLAYDCRTGVADIAAAVADHLARTIAAHQAIVYGRALSQEEMRDLLDKLLRAPARLTAPNGKRTAWLVNNQLFE